MEDDEITTRLAEAMGWKYMPPGEYEGVISTYPFWRIPGNGITMSLRLNWLFVGHVIEHLQARQKFLRLSIWTSNQGDALVYECRFDGFEGWQETTVRYHELTPLVIGKAALPAMRIKGYWEMNE